MDTLWTHFGHTLDTFGFGDDQNRSGFQGVQVAALSNLALKVMDNKQSQGTSRHSPSLNILFCWQETADTAAEQHGKVDKIIVAERSYERRGVNRTTRNELLELFVDSTALIRFLYHYHLATSNFRSKHPPSRRNRRVPLRRSSESPVGS